jgi:two-component system cell cycle response regulator
MIDEGNSSGNFHEHGDSYENMPDRGRILLIDDDITVLKLLENAFTMEGYKVYICDDSSSAMDIISAARPEMIILDIMMPKVNGYELLKEIKAKPEYSDIYVIFLSAKGNTDDRIKGLRFGADDYIAKPFVIGEIITKVEIMMRRSAHYKEKLLKDSLTDAYSRYYLNYRLAEELERYRRNKSVFSVAFIDLDHLKYINDRYGHQTGDTILKEITGFISRSIRPCDSIYRYGGEEFIILMPDTSGEKAITIIDRLRDKLGSEQIRVGGSALYVTFSAGIRQVRDINESIDEIIGDADKAMYYAKKCGRNRVVEYNKDISINEMKKTLLIVDDENTILKLLKERLSNIGYNVVTAKDGDSAIAAANEIRPDVVVLDLILPDIDGFEVCRQLKENSNTSSAKIIMLSKKKQKKSIVKGLTCGADDYVTKPFSMDELEARIMRVLNCID